MAYTEHSNTDGAEKKRGFMQGTLIVVETTAAFQVAYADNPDDWVATFRKADGFDAHAWAERMVQLYGERQSVEDEAG